MTLCVLAYFSGRKRFLRRVYWESCFQSCQRTAENRCWLFICVRLANKSLLFTLP